MTIAGVLAGAVLNPPVGADPIVPSTFVVEQAVPGVTFELPTSLAFLPDGRMLVSDRGGRVWMVENGIRNGIPVWDGRNEVFGTGDCGLLGITVDPNFSSNRYVYFLYTVDPDSNGVDDNVGGYGRLTRYQFPTVSSSAVDPASRTILFGTTWSDGPVITGAFHTVGGLEWASDGSLLVSVGDGASGLELDAGGLNPEPFLPGRVDPSQDIGAFRAQDLNSMAGKILRINPATGEGYSSNPFFQPAEPRSARSRVWAYGVRNSFRFTVRPGTGAGDPVAGDPGTLYMADVGWTEWEEINVAAGPGLNFGWPCHEGPEEQLAYQAESPPSIDCDQIEVEAPRLAWARSDSSLSVPPGSGLTGNCSILGEFYTGTRFPAIFQGAMFFADFGAHWVKVARFNSSEQLVEIMDFGTDMQGPVDFAQDPAGDLYYISMISGQVRRIRYTAGSGDDPGASASADDPVGAAPHSVAFSSAGSFSPIGRPLSFFWNFGDGQGSSNPNPSHAYAIPAMYQAVLTVTDDLGGLARDTVTVIVTASANFPSTTVLDDFERPDGPLGGSWIGNPWGLEISNGQLVQPIPGQAEVHWSGGVFGPDQEIYVTLDALTASPHHTLLLKSQGTGLGHIQVRYDHSGPNFSIATYAPQQDWVTVSVVFPFQFMPGDRFGARSYSNGVVEVYRNDDLVHAVTIASWPFMSGGGRLGMVIQDAHSSRLDDFGGGDIALGFNERPTATIVTPPDRSFFVTGDTIRMTGTGTDPEDGDKNLLWYWQVDQHHNNHVHPAIFTSNLRAPWFIGEHHDDGTGAHLGISLRITDLMGASDTAHVSVYPEVDLEPVRFQTIPTQPEADSETMYRFWLRNHGRMSSPNSRWTIRAGTHLIAQGDTLVPGRDSVRVSRYVPTTLGPGTYTVTVTADALGTVVEPDEANNTHEAPFTVLSSGGPDIWAPIFLEDPAGTPIGLVCAVEWVTNEISHGVVRYGTSAALGESLVVEGDALSHRVYLQSLSPHTLYYFEVEATDPAGNSRKSVLDTFETEYAPVSAVPAIPTVFALSPAFPNPARGGVRLTADLPRRAMVRFRVYDLHGRVIWKSVDAEGDAGRVVLSWPGFTQEGTRVRPGVYLVRVDLGSNRYARRVVVIR